MIGEANMLYVSKEYSNAVKLLTDVIKKVPQIPDPYQTLGLIYEDMNDKVKSLEFFMIAAHLTPKSPSLWKRLGLMSREQGKLRQSIYCFTKAIRLDNRDFDAIWDRSMLYAEMGNNRKAIAGLLMILKFNPNDFSIVLEIAKVR